MIQREIKESVNKFDEYKNIIEQWKWANNVIISGIKEEILQNNPGEKRLKIKMST